MIFWREPCPVPTLSHLLSVSFFNEMSQCGQIHIWRRIYLWLWVSVAIGWVWTPTPERENMGHLYKFLSLRYNFGQNRCLYSLYSCTVNVRGVRQSYMLGACICKCVEGAVLESEWPVEQGGVRAKGKTLWGKHCWGAALLLKSHSKQG